MKGMNTHRNVQWLPDRIAIIGAARSGLAAAQFLLSRGKRVFISDTRTREKLDGDLRQAGLDQVPSEAEGNTDRILEYELIVVSPGVPSDIPVLREARNKGIPVWAEVELGFRYSKAPFVAVTGSSGKSTTVSLLGSVFAAARKEHIVAGNIGLPLISAAPGVSAGGYIVAEISSFQLENIDLFRPKVALVLNLMKNHLDRYAGEEEYYTAKKRIAENMRREDTVVINARDERLRAWARQLQKRVRLFFFGAPVEKADSVWSDGAWIVASYNGTEQKIVPADALQIRGSHNRENACAAAAAAVSIGIETEAIAQGLRRFQGLAHRLEFVRTLQGVGYYNDSKSTTGESVLCALEAFENNVHLIAGGKDKGCDFSIVSTAIQRKVKTVYLIGEAAERMYKEWHGYAPIQKASSLEDAVLMARANAKTGDVVVLSPGCSSFDMFTSFEHRGDEFKKIVLGL